ncbi:ABC transporter ATP-binding protein [Bifidobacterium aquikefiricola]|uniref:ABC transporter ATP-binding protein n=1 Tax=Bifidobacterium aquikefiricola TaxID=3059038 RepID=A0AB39U4K5_9BIFI
MNTTQRFDEAEPSSSDHSPVNQDKHAQNPGLNDALVSRPASDAVTSATGPAILELVDVSYAYSKGGKQILHNLSHAFKPGLVYAITGPSGAGKTTLLSLISGLTSPTGGKVLYQGKDLGKQDRYDFRSHDIGVIFQSFNLLPALTVTENIVLSMDASGKKFNKPKQEIALDLLEAVHLPKEYANERILHLSGGEQQRVAIARALSYDPKIIVADEPTGNLDLGTQRDIMDIFARLAHENDKCVIIVTHSPEVAQESDEVFPLAPLRRNKPTSALRPAASGRH